MAVVTASCMLMAQESAARTIVQPMADSEKSGTADNTIISTVSASDPAMRGIECYLKTNFVAYVMGCTAQFNDISVFHGVDRCSYSIDFGDGNSATGTNYWFTHNYAEGGYYEVCFTVQFCNSSGQTCSDTKCMTVYIPCWGFGMRTTEAPGSTSAETQPKAYPNPAGVMLNITMPEGITGGVNIIDASGKIVAAATNTGKNYWQADVAALAPGMYFVTSENSNGEIIKCTFIKE